MKIIAITSLFLDPTLLVRIDTDEGITGWGECSSMNSRAIAAHIRYSLAPLVIGKDPFDIESIMETMLATTYKTAWQTQAMAMSRIGIYADLGR